MRLFQLTLSLLLSLCVYAQNSIGPGNTLSFDGIDDKVDLGASFNNLTLPVSICAWIKPQSSSLILPIFSSCADFQNWYGVFLTVDNNRLQASIGSGLNGFTINGRNTLFVSISEFKDEWIHVASVINGANDMKIYVNGIEMTGVYHGTATTMSNTTNGHAHIGFHQKGFQRHYAGEIDALSIWDIALSETNIRELMCKKINPLANGLLAAYDFNESTTSTSITDISGNGINGTKQNGINHILSGAPIGDHSEYFYQAGPFNNYTDSITIQNQQVLLSDITSPAIGFQVYKVDTLPSITNGLNNCIDSSYYGVFLAKDIFNQQDPKFNVELTGKTILHERPMNNSNAWTVYSNTVPEVQRIEIITGLQNYSLGEDTTICKGDSLIIVLPVDFENVLWNDGDTTHSKIISIEGLYWVSSSSICGNISDTLDVSLAEYQNYSLGEDTIICTGDSLTLFLPGDFENVLWSDGDTSQSKTITIKGMYWVSSSSICGNFSDTLDVSVVSSHDPLGFDTTLCDGESLIIDLPADFENVIWNDGDTNHTKTITSEDDYWVSYNSICGGNSDTLSVTVENCSVKTLEIPNVFTPNDDGENDVYKINISGYEELDVKIYNRWGNLVFESNQLDFRWDGTFNGNELSDGVYFMILVVKVNQEKSIISQDITLMR